MLETIRHLAVGTDRGAFLFRPQGPLKEWEMVGYGLYGRKVSSLTSDSRARVIAGLEGETLVRTENWVDWESLYQGLTHPDVRSVACDPQTSQLFAGTAPAAVFNSSDEGKYWLPLGQTSTLSAENGWTHPDPPHTPCIFRLFCHPTVPDCLVAGVQAGGVIVSQDGGRTWSNNKAGLSHQLNDLCIHREEPHRIYAANFLGFHRSDDLGKSWRLENHGLPYHDAQALCVHSIDPNRLLLSVNHPIEEQSILFLSNDGGLHWELACSELPAGEGLMITSLESGGGVYFAGTSEGFVFGSRDGCAWELVRAELPPVRTLHWVGEHPSKSQSNFAK